MTQSRRGFFKQAALSTEALLTRPPAGDLIQRENARPGTPGWLLSRVMIANFGKSPGYRSLFIEGYCSRQSVEAGETLDIMVSTNPPARFQIEIFRMGYYGGLGARRMATLGPFQGKVQPDPEIGPNRLRECRWEPAAQVKIPAGWPSGVYLGRLTILPETATEGPWQSFVIFIVRDNRPADILLQSSDNTWQAYNRWPDDYSFYTDPRGAHSPGTEVSFDRPYGKSVHGNNPQSVGSGEFLLLEFPLCYWLEKHGYDVTYCSNSDMLSPARAARCKVFISVGHDEYWDPRQYDSAKAAIASGTSEFYLCGNSVSIIAPFRESADGRPNRIIRHGGRYGGRTENEKRRNVVFEMDGPDEALLIGARTVYPANGGGDWIVTKPDHWMFEGAGVKRGDRIPGLVGWEFHGEPAGLPGLEVVAEGIALKPGSRESAHWTATIYPGPKRNFVFNAATIWWAQGLASPPGHRLPWEHGATPQGPDERVQRITHNLLRRALAAGGRLK
ncbi:MAG: N,N-dimethylformamidase beta subunit family domain-containing protein [Bryobacteraceae bacterium]